MTPMLPVLKLLRSPSDALSFAFSEVAEIDISPSSIWAFFLFFFEMQKKSIDNALDNFSGVEVRPVLE